MRGRGTPIYLALGCGKPCLTCVDPPLLVLFVKASLHTPHRSVVVRSLHVSRSERGGYYKNRQHSAATTRRLTHRASPLRPPKRQLPSVGQAASWSSCTAPACGLIGRRHVCLPLPSTARGPHIPPPRMPLPLQVQTFPWQPPTRTSTSPPKLQPVAASKAGWSELDLV